MNLASGVKTNEYEKRTYAAFAPIKEWGWNPQVQNFFYISRKSSKQQRESCAMSPKISFENFNDICVTSMYAENKEDFFLILSSRFMTLIPSFS